MTKGPRNRLIAAMFLMLLGGCSLLGSGGKAELYRFGVAAPAPAAAGATPAAARPLVVLYRGASFQRAVRGIRILTVSPPKVGYIAEARWISPASELFDAAVLRQLDQLYPSVRVVRVGDATPFDYLLTIDIRRFEAVYPGNMKANPDVVIEARAKLVRWLDRAVVAEWPIVQQERTPENRVSTIVAAFDRGTTAVVSQIAARTQTALLGPGLSAGN